MDNALFVSLLGVATPLIAVVALMLLVPASLAPQSRLAGAGTLFGSLLLTAALMLLVEHRNMLVHFTTADATIASLLLLSAGISIAPLADRARPASLMLIAPVASYLAFSALFAFNAASTISLMSGIIALSLTALVGSAMLPLHPSRYSPSGQLRTIATSQSRLLIGWVLLAASFLALTVLLGRTPDYVLVILSVIIAALATLLTTRVEDGLAKAGQAIAAASLLTACATINLQIAIMLGLVASLCVNRSEAISASLRVDDPHHFSGTLLLPAIFGLLVPGILDSAQLAAGISWLTLALITGIALSAMVWPVAMLLSGLALPKRNITQGIRA